MSLIFSEIGNRGLSALTRGFALGAFVAVSLIGPSPSAASVAASGQWGFEQVTPAQKGGGAVQPIENFQTRPDGRALLHSATAPYEGASAESGPLYTRYLAERKEDGWVNRGLDAPFDALPPIGANSFMTVSGTSHNLEFAVVTSTRALAPGAKEGGGNLYLRNTATGSYRLLAANDDPLFTRRFSGTVSGEYVKYVAPDGKSVLFTSPFALIEGAPVGGTGGPAALYRWTDERGLEVISRLPDDAGGGYVAAGTAVGFRTVDGGERNSLPRANGADVIYFQALGGAAYRWEGGDVSLISGSASPEDEGRPVETQVLATTSNGDYALLQTEYAERLTPDTPNFAEWPYEQQPQRVLYRYERVTGKLEYVGISSRNVYAPADQMSQDGRTIVFKTQHQLTPDAAEFHGYDDPRDLMNYYVWRDGTLRFVTSFVPGGGSGGPLIRLLSDDGRYLAFVDNSQENASRFGVADNTSVKCAEGGANAAVLCHQVYRFDVERPASLECVSCRAGVTPRGSSGDPGIRFDAYGKLAMNGRAVYTVTDAGTVFFTSSDDLIPEDNNRLLDAYAFRDGKLQLASPAVQGASTRFLDATPDGASVFVATNARLAETDTDRSVDIYVTRKGAGFPYEASSTELCTGSDCRDAFPSSRGTGDNVLGGSSILPGDQTPWTPSAKLRVRVTAVMRVRSAMRVSVRTSDAGKLRVSGRLVKTTTRRAGGAGETTITVPLTTNARAAIRRNGRIRTRLRVSLSPLFGKAAVTTSIRTVR